MTLKPEIASLTATAIQAALGAGEILLRGFGGSFRTTYKEGRHNLVTEYDTASEKYILDLIKKRFPSHSTLSEEAGKEQKKSPIVWIIDPLDGTVNFAHGIPIFSVSIAVAVNGKIVSGVVYQPLLKELFIAEKGQGAYLNGTRLAVSNVSKMDKAFLVTGFPYDVDKNPLGCIDQMATVLKQGIPLRRLGSAALDLSYVAAGRFDGYWEVSLHPWDLAAGKLLVEEAGGIVSHYDGLPHKIFCHDTILATNNKLHKSMVKFLKPYLNKTL